MTKHSLDMNMSSILTRAKVLIVDDDEAFCSLVAEILEPKGYEVVKVHSTSEAEDVLDRDMVDVVLLDIVMPGESGMKFLERFDTDGCQVPMVMVTGYPQMDTAVDSFKHGAVDYLSKPITPEQLIQTVQKAIDDRPLVMGERTVIMSEGTKSIAGYRILRTLGEGNMGVVYLVEGEDAKGVKNEYAMKVLKPLPADDGDRLENHKKRFLVEARAAFAIQHPNIVQIHDYGTCDNNMPYILMEYCEGKTLDILMQEREFEISEKCIILKQIAFALDSIHDNDICHRDIKPANVIVNGDLEAKLTDFGIARLRDSNLTMTSEVFGTPAYLAPEAFESAKVDYRADIFSLGSLAYELFTGQRAFEGPTIASIARQIRLSDPVWPRKVMKDFPKRLDAMVRKMLRKNPEERYHSAFEIYMELNAFLDQEESEEEKRSKGFFSRLIGR